MTHAAVGRQSGRSEQRKSRRWLMPLVWLGALAAGNVGWATPLSLAPGQQAVSIPLALDPARMPESLAVELDGYDVSSFVTATAASLELALQVPLTGGAHELVVLAVYPDGAIETLAVHSLQVAANRLLAADNWKANVTLDTSYLAVKKDKDDFPDTEHWASNAGAVVQGAYAEDDWQFETRIDALYNSRAENNGSGNHWDLPNYRVAVARRFESGTATLQAGDVVVGGESLAFSSFRRRGVALSHASLQGMIQAEAFALQSEPTTSARQNVLFPSQSEDKVAGTHAILRPLSGEYQSALQVTASYLTGSTTYPGNGFYVPEPTEFGGSVLSGGLLSEWLSGSLAFQAEFASSDFDFDGVDQGEGEVSDDASQFQIRLASGVELPSGPLDQWSLRLLQSTVGRFFYSLGNRTLPGDLDTQRLELAGSRGGFSFALDASEATNNVDDDPLVADYRQETSGLVLYYTPSGVDPTQGVWRWIGLPTLQLGARYTDQAQDQEDAALVGYDIDNRTDELSAGVTFVYPEWQWYLQQSRIELDDAAEAVFIGLDEVFTPGPDSVTDQTLLQVTYNPMPGIYLAPLAQYNRVEEDQTGRRYTTSRFGFDSQFHLLPQKLILVLNYSEDRNRQDYNDPVYLNGDTLYRSGSGQLLFKAVPARGLQPGLDLYTKGSVGRFVDRTGEAGDETWQLLLGANVYWAE